MKKKGTTGGSDEPKRPLNSYLEFYKEERPKILSETSNISTIEISKLISQKWKNMNPDEKDKYAQRYKVNLTLYKEQTKELKKIRKKNSDFSKTGPKHPLNSYLEFARTERPKILAEKGSLSLKEVVFHTFLSHRKKCMMKYAI